MAGISDYNRGQMYQNQESLYDQAGQGRSADFRPYYNNGNNGREFENVHHRGSPSIQPVAPFHLDNYSTTVSGSIPRSLNFSSPPGSAPDSPDEPIIKTFFQKGISFVADNLLSHPFLVLRRQCQVHVEAGRYHLFPITLIGPTFYIVQRQGFSVLWKGLGSTLIIKGMTLAVEDVTSKVTPWPKDISRHSSLKSFFQHILLKSLSLALTTPFYSASLVETVQSEVASETTGFFDVFREGLWRIVSWPSTGRLVPLHILVIPTIAHGILAYVIFTGIKSVSLTTIRRVRENKERKQGALSKDTNVSYYMEMTASLIGNMVADMLLFPLETILHRLHLQGTRTIIDSLDSGIEVTPIITSYGGLFDCLRTTVDEEGFSGLYKGFGALILQYGVQMLLIRAVKIVLETSPFNGGSTSRENLRSIPIQQEETKYPPFRSSPGFEGHQQSRPDSTGITGHGRSITTPTSDLYGHSRETISSPRGRDPPVSIETRYRSKRSSSRVSPSFN